MKEYSSVNIPIKPKILASTKSNNYLLNVLLHLESKDKGGKEGVWVDENGKYNNFK